MESAVEAAIATAATADAVRDGAAIELARVYAREIDGGGELARVGPLLLAVLAALLLTPQARAVAFRNGKAPDDGTRKNPVDELRRKRDRRERGDSTG